MDELISRHALAISCLVLSLFLLPGCGGCRWLNDPPQGKDRPLTEEEKKAAAEKKKEKPDFEPVKLSSLPDEARLALKPGHWTALRCELKANNFDFIGDIDVSCVGRAMTPLELAGSRFQLQNSRPVSLVRGQSKSADLPIFVVPPSSESKSLRINPSLNERLLSRSYDFGAYPATRLLPHQFYFLVLAANPDRYGFLKATNVARPPVYDFEQLEGTRLNYIVTTPDVEQGAPLADSALLWTATAYAVWDGLDPDALTSDQQVAMLDWIHWGGQLIVGGPKSLEKLRLGFMRDYLPVSAGEMTNADPGRVAELNEHWSLQPNNPKPGRSYELKFAADSPLQIVSLNLQTDGRFVPSTGELVAERRVGRGRVVVTAFAVDDRRIVNWASFDNFLHNCLLRRPARQFSPGRDQLGVVEWKDLVASTQDPRLSSNVRYFTRDAVSGNLRQGRDESSTTITGDGNRLQASGGISAKTGYRSDDFGGVATWSDFNSSSLAARESLVNAAGISVPNGQFVMKLLGIYLLCLVPVNWTVFRVLQRVEWAWVAAMLISVLGAVSVIRFAQLDIGFVRSRTEIAVVESQPGYSRAHVTRFIGLYTSLSTRYQVKFDDTNGVGLPFSTDPSSDKLRLSETATVKFRQQQQNQLSEIPIFSNSTGLIHSEQMVELPGMVKLASDEQGDGSVVRIENGTDRDVKSAMLVYRIEDQFEIIPVGDLNRGATVTIKMGSASDEEILDALDTSPVTQSRPVEGQISLRLLMELALDPHQLENGDMRLVGWSDKDLDGITIQPESNQHTTRALWIFHLRYGPPADPSPDTNLFEDVSRDFEDLFDS